MARTPPGCDPTLKGHAPSITPAWHCGVPSLHCAAAGWPQSSPRALILPGGPADAGHVPHSASPQDFEGRGGTLAQSASCPGRIPWLRQEEEEVELTPCLSLGACLQTRGAHSSLDWQGQGCGAAGCGALPAPSCAQHAPWCSPRIRSEPLSWVMALPHPTFPHQREGVRWLQRGRPALQEPRGRGRKWAESRPKWWGAAVAPRWARAPVEAGLLLAGQEGRSSPSSFLPAI